MGFDNCQEKGKTRYFYTGNQVGWLNYVGDMNYVAGGPPGSGLSAGLTAPIFFPHPTNRRYWQRENATFTQDLLDACYPTIELQWFAEIEIDPTIIFRVSDKSFYVEDKDGVPKFYDARAERAPSINITLGEWLQPQYEISDLQLNINNRDGFYNEYLPNGAKYRQWSGAKVTVKVGFGEKYDNYLPLFEGYVTEKQGLTGTRDTVTIRAYDKLDIDQVPIPPQVFNSDGFPDIDEDASGKKIPLVYGDWTEEVPAWGAIPAYCVNANDPLTDQFIYKISDIALESVDSVWLHRGNRKEGEPDGPVKLLNSEIVIQLDQGRVIIPKGADVLETEITNFEALQAGPGSTVNLVTAKDASVNFIAKKIQVGDRLLKRKTGEYATVLSVANTQMTTSGGVTFTDGDEFIILTTKYAFFEGDKISVVCKGKNLNTLSVNRLSDIDININKPNGVSVGIDGTFWVVDDNTQKVYNITFDREIKKQIDYTDIDPACTSMSGVSITGDNKLWLTDPIQSKVYRYDLDSDDLGLEFTTGSVTGISGNLVNLVGIAAKADNNIWIVDQASGDFYEINPFQAVNPFVVTTFNKSAFDNTATMITDVGYDELYDQVICVDLINNKCYRLDETNGSLISSFLTTSMGPNVTYVTGCCVAQDGTIFFVDRGAASVYNYTDIVDASSNPCIIARDLLQKFGGHTYEEFDLSWMDTARQLSTYKARVSITDEVKLVSYVSKILQQFNIAFFVRFQKFALFWIEFNNFTTSGKLVKEKDIKENSFNPSKELNQYFNMLSSTYGKRPFQEKALTSDTYVSPAGVSFVKKEISKTIETEAMYRRTDLDRILPLMVRLAVPEPEFVNVTFGFRQMRTQMQDFLTVHFDGDVDCVTGRKSSGRRFNNIPCMVRKITYDLHDMSLTMKLWSLGSTGFPGFEPVGNVVGGYLDPIVLSTIGRPARIAPIGKITASSLNSVDLEQVNGQDAENRTAAVVGNAWQAGYKVCIVDGSTKDILKTLEILSVSGDTVTFTEDHGLTLTPTTYNLAGFINGGHYLQYASYNDTILVQKDKFGSYGRPLTNYPASRTAELEEQRGALHSFDDGGKPYVLYPVGFFQAAST